jgi:hypothetical protein
MTLHDLCTILTALEATLGPDVPVGYLNAEYDRSDPVETVSIRVARRGHAFAGFDDDDALGSRFVALARRMSWERAAG